MSTLQPNENMPSLTQSHIQLEQFVSLVRMCANVASSPHPRSPST
eukprot:CAMPEP_0114160598 /NCGR_PEP_ID=MMETSP0043_2-20121206/28447_1 /TAXON_ID=464988 /ORGANISM="Hemiselmis andersenii, Strain CCMP644" /LENGTH=44 /DNA_ID= /DNA_START= /DNA_END= /DNA_ORIENTATION=